MDKFMAKYKRRVKNEFDNNEDDEGYDEKSNFYDPSLKYDINFKNPFDEDDDASKTPRQKLLDQSSTRRNNRITD